MADNVPPALTQLLGQSVQRSQYQNPLFQAVTNQAFRGLPAYAREGLSLDANLPAIDPAMLQGGGGGGTSAAKAALAGALGGLGGSAINGGDWLKAITALVKKLMGNKGIEGHARTGFEGIDWTQLGQHTDPSQYWPEPGNAEEYPYWTPQPTLTPGVTTSDELTGIGQDAPTFDWTQLPGQNTWGNY